MPLKECAYKIILKSITLHVLCIYHLHRKSFFRSQIPIVLEIRKWYSEFKSLERNKLYILWITCTVRISFFSHPSFSTSSLYPLSPVSPTSLLHRHRSREIVDGFCKCLMENITMEKWKWKSSYRHCWMSRSIWKRYGNCLCISFSYQGNLLVFISMFCRNVSGLK